MELSLGMVIDVNRGKWVLNLNKSLYGLIQSSEKISGLLKTVLYRRGYHQSLVEPCVFYIKDSVILTYVDGCVIVSQKKETITSLIQSLKNVTKNYLLTDEGDISNHIGFNIKKKLDGTFKLSESHLVEK